MITTLLIQTETTPMTVSLPMVAPMTQEEFYSFCLANRDLRIERTAAGEVEIMPPAFSDTGNRNFNLAVQIGLWAEKDGTGLGFDSSAGFTLSNGAMRWSPTGLRPSPDASWMKAERWHTLTTEEQASFAPICPDFVIELRSASDTLSGLQTKMQEYIENGTLLGWLIDRKNQTVYIYRPNQDPEILENPSQVSGDPELPGFSLLMAKIW